MVVWTRHNTNHWGCCWVLLVPLGVWGIIYLKCRNKETRSVLLPYFDAHHQSVDLVSKGGRYGQLDNMDSYRPATQPQPEEQLNDPICSNNPASGAVPPSDPGPTAPPHHLNKRLNTTSSQHQSRRSQPSSLVSSVIRTK